MRVVAILAALLVAGIVVLGARLYGDWSSAEGQYRLAERLYQAGDYERAEAVCERALRRNSSHLPAKALLMELRFIQGRGNIVSAGDYGKYFIDSMGVVSHAIMEMDTAFARADRAQREGDLETAERELRKILEFAKWMPTGVEITARTRQAKECLDTLNAHRCVR